MGESWKHALWKKLETKGYVFDSIYMKYPE